MKSRGVCKFWHSAKQYGFIVPDVAHDGIASDVYFNGEATKGATIRTGDAVSYELGEPRQGRLRATNVEIIDA